jgi:hypothetical protein
VTGRSHPFELMDRILPDILATVSTQTIRATRALLR